MLRLIFYFFITLILSSCDSNESTVNKGNSTSADSNILKIGDILFEIAISSKQEFEKYPQRFKDGDWHRKETIDDTFNVSRIKDSLIFRARLKTIFLKDYIDSTDESSNVLNVYLFNDKSNGFWVVDRYYYEWSTKVLVDKIRGDTTNVLPAFDFSPNREYILSMDNSMMDGEGDFLLHKLIKGKYQLMGSYLLNKGVAEEIKWVSEKTILLKTNIADTGFYYTKLNLK